MGSIPTQIGEPLAAMASSNRSANRSDMADRIAKLLLIATVTAASCARAQTTRPASPAVVSPRFRSAHGTCIDLAGTWEFQTDPQKRGETERWFEPSRAFDRTIQVPGCWEAQGVTAPGPSHPVA